MIEVIEKMLTMSIEEGDIIVTRYGNCVVRSIGGNHDNTIFICDDVYDIEHVIEINDNQLVPVVFMVEEEVD
jgi:hypothetical protein